MNMKCIRVRITTDEQGVAKFQYAEYYAYYESLTDFMVGDVENWDVDWSAAVTLLSEVGEPFRPYVDAALATRRFEVVTSNDPERGYVSKLSHRKKAFPICSVVIDMMFFEKEE